MELITLDSSFQPDKLVEGYSSLIWTERYNTAGDFEFISNDVAGTIAMLPEDSCVSLRESTVPMLVETHKIEKPKNEAPKITVTGRSYEVCALERRASVNSLPSATARSAWTLTAASESDAAYKAIRIVIGDVLRTQSGSTVLTAVTPAVSSNDAMPQIDLTLPADYSNTTPNTYEIKAGVLYDTTLELLTTNNHGIKSVRPLPGNNKIRVEIYNGANLTSTVTFDARLEQLDDGTYLLSKQGSTNVAYVYGSNGSQQVLKTTAPEPSGMDRRILLLDASSDTTTNTSDVRNSRGLIELYKNNATALFDGEVAAQVAAGFNNTYFLGDILMLLGEYGLSQDVRVTEFIRSFDSSGYKAYPTFQAIT